jgi:hypothetical protein
MATSSIATGDWANGDMQGDDSMAGAGIAVHFCFAAACSASARINASSAVAASARA